MLYVNAFLTGTAYGFTVCGWSCLPYIGPYVLGRQGGFTNGLQSAILFSFGKLVSYAVLGALAGYLGNVVLGSVFFKNASAVVMLWLGFTLFRKEKNACGNGKHGLLKNHAAPQMIIMGVTAGAVPCLPMSGMLLYAASTNSAPDGCLIATAFGLGTAFSPMLIIAGAAGWMSRRISVMLPSHNLVFRRICGFVLVSGAVKLFFDGWGIVI